MHHLQHPRVFRKKGSRRRAPIPKTGCTERIKRPSMRSFYTRNAHAILRFRPLNQQLSRMCHTLPCYILALLPLRVFPCPRCETEVRAEFEEIETFKIRQHACLIAPSDYAASEVPINGPNRIDICQLTESGHASNGQLVETVEIENLGENIWFVLIYNAPIFEHHFTLIDRPRHCTVPHFWHVCLCVME